MFPPECQREIAAGIAGSQLVITTEPATPQGRTESRGNPSPADVPGREGSLGFEWLRGWGRAGKEHSCAGSVPIGAGVVYILVPRYVAARVSCSLTRAARIFSTSGLGSGLSDVK